MAFPRIEIYPRANQPLTGDEDFVVSQGGVLRKTSTASVAALVEANLTPDYPAPGGPYALTLGTPVALKNGLVVAADASDATKMPCIGFYQGSVANTVKIAGTQIGLSGLTANSAMYVAPGGGLTSTAPTGSGTVSQCVGKAQNSGSIWVTLFTPIYNQS
jgi:hypothetical protein